MSSVFILQFSDSYINEYPAEDCSMAYDWSTHAERAARAHSPWDYHLRTSRRPVRHSRCNDMVRNETVQVRRCRRESHFERKNGQLVSHPMFDGQPVK